MTTTQIQSLGATRAAAFTTEQIVALTTGQVAAMGTAQIAALATAQVAAMETRDVAVLTTAGVAALSTEHGRNALLTLKIPGGDQLAMVQDVQVHPVTRRPLHVDFYRVDAEHAIDINYARGIGVQQNFGESFRWFALAAQSGDHSAIAGRGNNIACIKYW